MITPALTALMCDGMGSFSDADYKRMLLAFDRIYYLLPEGPVEFLDVTGRPLQVLFPAGVRGETEAFVPCGHALDDAHRRALLAATDADLTTDALRAAAAAVPRDELLYTWRLVNADGGFGNGRSIGLDAGEMARAQLLLLNKFLLAADARSCVPITGKGYVHRLLTLKYQQATRALAEHLPDLLPPRPHGADLRHGPFVMRLISELVPDAELEARPLAEIVAYKRRNAALFEAFSLTVRDLVRELESLPAERSFERDVAEVLATRVWKARREMERELRSSWDEFFLSGMKEAIRSDGAKAVAAFVGPTLAFGVLPQLSHATIALSPALGVAGVASWVAAELLGTFAKQREARKNGLYYLLGFRDA
jgi:hypothetical protein